MSKVKFIQEENEVQEVNQEPQEKPQEKSGFASYESLIFKWHKIGASIQFQNGFYTAKSKAEEKMIESDPIFGVKIFKSQQRNEVV